MELSGMLCVLHGVQGVEGSNPFTPTISIKDLAQKCSKSFYIYGCYTKISPTKPLQFFNAAEAVAI